jgi:hypothetical protein
MKLLIKFPTRSRRKQFFETFNKYQEYISEPTTRFLITIDEDDSDMNNDEVLSILESYDNVSFVIGQSNSKIHAINRDIDTSEDWDIILLASDDMIPQVKGFDKVINTLMNANYPDTDGILFFNDGFKGQELNTLCILGKKYYEKFNYIYYPEYKSMWSDNEFMLVGNILEKQTYFDEVIIEHEHPDWGFGGKDSIHIKNVENETHDKNLFLNRQSNKFYL